MAQRLKIVLISPKGPLYRRRGGIFKQSLRYMPLTLPTLASLIPEDLNADVVCVDEGIADVDLNLDADLIGMTVITGTAVRAYELAEHFRQRGITVVLGGPHVTLVPDDAQPHADSIVVGYAEEEWPRLLQRLRGRLTCSRVTRNRRTWTWRAFRCPTAASCRVPVTNGRRIRGDARLYS